MARCKVVALAKDWLQFVLLSLLSALVLRVISCELLFRSLSIGLLVPMSRACEWDLVPMARIALLPSFCACSHGPLVVLRPFAAFKTLQAKMLVFPSYHGTMAVDHGAQRG